MAGDATPTLAQATGLAMGAVGALEGAGAGQGRRVALIGTTSNSYLVAWLALVLAGAEVAMVNPDYPDDLLAEMLAQLAPGAVVWTGRAAGPSVAPGATTSTSPGWIAACLRRPPAGRPSQPAPEPGGLRWPMRRA